jgi:hypothetical protein
MATKFKPIDLSGVQTYRLADRTSKVSTNDFAKTWRKGSTYRIFLAGRQLKAVISAIVRAHRQQRTFLFGMGAHVIKVGLNPVVIDLMERGIISGVAMNGAGIIHDVEVAMIGQTSEDVAAALDDGSFGMARETCDFLSKAVAAAQVNSAGLGEAVGQAVLDKKLPVMNQSILAAGARLGIPVTVHVAALEKGVYLNMGSAVILPEIFLKATTLVRNLGHTLEDFTTVNLDFIKHYRPLTNVITRPTARGGQGINLVGHHEILLPLIAAGVIEQLD